MVDYLEDETCRRFVLPALDRAGWNEDQIAPQYTINAGRIRVTARGHQRDQELRADYALEYEPGLVIGVVEAKRTRKDAQDGIEQAKRYAVKLDVPFAYATNGTMIYEIDLATGMITEVQGFPSPDELWSRYRSAKGVADGLPSELLTAPFDASLRNWDNTPKRPRYYQQVAVNRAVHAIARGDTRILLVLATGTGKTLAAFQIVSKLWHSRWTRGRKPRVLYLADRNILVDQPKDEYFEPVFGEAVYKLGGGEAKHGRNIYFALYQSMDQPGDQEALFKQYDPDYFDLIIVDECHRGSAREDSQWRNILEHFSPATQIGLTATPVSSRDADTYHYFGDPIYEYSLAQGIEDGFLAPYRVRKVRLNVDMTGWRPEPGQRDIYGKELPDDLYGPREYERIIAILERTGEAAQYLTEYLYNADRMGKTIVFCENTDHAGRMMQALHNANRDMVRRYPNYVCRITARDESVGRALLDGFRKVDSDQPVIAVTSRLLSTGVDIPTVRNIVLFRRIASMPEFKQVIGRGTRLFEDAGKLSFDIIDFVEATRLFNDPGFDGIPIRVFRDDTDETGHLIETEAEETEQDAEGEVTSECDDSAPTPDDPRPADQVVDPDQINNIIARGRRYYVKDVPVYVWGDAFYLAEGDGTRLRLVEYRQYVKERVLELHLSPTELRSQWAQAKARGELTEKLGGEYGVSVEELAEQLGRPEADPIDLLIHVAWDAALVTREERARRVRREHRKFLESFGPEAEQILERVLEQYASHGPDELSPQVLRLAPFTEMGSVVELAGRFGGAEDLKQALDQLGQHIYDVA
ncbi:type I restriction enzyme R subunit [Amycolatopsis bartoniae]|uniref:DEAD/DEAH box helicase n=1 Tax=Amycolatopsis bartoniae TaxID=941986 RepID=A0A8H9IZE3_9PSEU|nr:type I restriction endonuclease subunit R [Amycolatopsis bartoniae]MBB2936867.1 type I restriction enzyme R subunit [Amycolatopsis bartoniae]GHF50767.1 DEAD/DEAH box helicase [Amycolatopsis bartoniae]